VKEIIESLAQQPGVHLAALVMADGVPVIAPGRSLHGGAARPSAEGSDPLPELDVLAGLCVGWIEEATRAIAPLSFETPQRALLRAARGTVLLRRCDDVLLLVVVGAGLVPEEMHLPIEAAAARLERVRRTRAANAAGAHAAPPAASAAPAPAAQPAANAPELNKAPLPARTRRELSIDASEDARTKA